MANASIFSAFERMWQHIVAKIGEVSSDAKTYTDQETAKKAQVQLITWEDDD